jgi:hypothetical protein
LLHHLQRFRPLWKCGSFVPAGAEPFHALVARINPADADRRFASESKSAAHHREAARTVGCSFIRTNDATSFADERRARFVTRDEPSDKFELKKESGRKDTAISGTLEAKDSSHRRSDWLRPVRPNGSC